MALSIYHHSPYCYLIKYAVLGVDTYELFVVVPTSNGKKMTFSPSGSTLTEVDDEVPLTVETLVDVTATAGYVSKRYAIDLSETFDPEIAQIIITVRDTSVHGNDWHFLLYFSDADDIEAISSIQVSGQVALNCPYVYAHGYNGASDDHFPRMLIARKGYDYIAFPSDESPGEKEEEGTNIHKRTVHLIKNTGHTSMVWLSPTFLNDAAHMYNDPDNDGYYFGEIAYSDKDKKKKGKVKNNAHPVQPDSLELAP